MATVPVVITAVTTAMTIAVTIAVITAVTSVTSAVTIAVTAVTPAVMVIDGGNRYRDAVLPARCGWVHWQCVCVGGAMTHRRHYRIATSLAASAKESATTASRTADRL